MYHDFDDRLEATERTDRQFERAGEDPPDHSSIEWREAYYDNLEKLMDEDW